MKSRRERHEAISQGLQQRFPDDLVQTKRPAKGAGEVSYVPWYYYAQRLNELEPLNWESEITHVKVVPATDQQGNDISKLLMVVQVTINGRTYAGTGTSLAAKESWGGAHAEAYSQAFRRACAHAGLGLYFYDEEGVTSTLPEGVSASFPHHGVDHQEEEGDDDEPRRDVPVDSADRGDASGGASGPVGGDNVAEDEDGGEGRGLDDPVTEDQHQRLADLGKTGVFNNEELTRWRTSLERKPTKGNAGRIIREMKDRYKSKTGNEYQDDGS